MNRWESPITVTGKLWVGAGEMPTLGMQLLRVQEAAAGAGGATVGATDVEVDFASVDVPADGASLDGGVVGAQPLEEGVPGVPSMPATEGWH
jgi:hypothetical protein